MTAPTHLKAATLTAAHGFFTRQGGVSTGIYESLQMGRGARGDTAENVAENRRRALDALGLPGVVLVAPYQVHSAEAVILDAESAALWAGDPGQADGVVTRDPNVAVAALAADCAPVLMEDPGAGVVGACHAGWRGALGGIVEATLARMVEAGADRSRIRAAIGPCIGPEAYEVGAEYVARFTGADPENAAYFRPAAPGAEPGKARFDLPGYIAERRLSGVAAETLGRCTYAEPDLFFSHRRATHRGEYDYGRLISIICPRWR